MLPMIGPTIFIPGCCAVCGGEPTVKSHIIPRAIAHDLRGGEKHLVSGEIDRPGVKFLQSGRWDPYLLCRDHEEQLSHIDDYGVTLARRFFEIASDASRPQSHTIPVVNERPDLLQAFFLGLIWKKNLSNQVKGNRCRLGPYAALIQDVLFAKQSLSTPLFLVQSPTAIDGQRIPLAVEPYRVKLRSTNAWKCDLGWLSAVVTLDKRGWPREWLQFDATTHDPALVITMDLIDIRLQPGLAPVLQSMRSAVRKFRRPSASE